MGSTIKNLAKAEVSTDTIFNHRFVVEVCEQFHVHYRDLRLLLSTGDFKELAQGMVQALDRWKQRGYPRPKSGQHIELCRTGVACQPVNMGIQVNKNRNLYKKNEGKIFAEGADFNDEEYIHLKIRDKRIEMSVEEFKQFAKVISDARSQLS